MIFCKSHSVNYRVVDVDCVDVKDRWIRRLGGGQVLINLLSSDLCHVRCACMAGHPNLNKKLQFLGEGRLHWDLPGSSLWCAVSFFVPCFLMPHAFYH